MKNPFQQQNDMKDVNDMHDNNINSINNVIFHSESIQRVKLGKWIGRILNMMMIQDIVIMTYLIVRASRGSKF